MKGRKLLAVCLTASMFMSVAACGKKKNEETQPTVSDVSGSETTTTTREISSGDEKASPNNNVDYSADVVAETDPYFESSETELMVPTDPSKTVEYFTVLHNPAFAGKYISMDYILKYVMPADVQSQLEQLVLPDEAAKYNEIYNGYMDVGTAIFNSKGEYLFSLRTRETIGFSVCGDVFEFSDGRIGMFFGEMLDNASVNPSIMIYSDKGEFIEEKPVPDLRMLPSQGHHTVLSDGSILFYSESVLLLVDKDANMIWQTFPENFMSISEGNPEGFFVLDNKLYSTFSKTVVDENNELITSDRTYQEIDLKTGELLGDKSAMSKNIPQALFQGDNEIYGVGANGIVKVDIFTGNREALINWNETDVNCKRLDMSMCQINGAEGILFFQHPDKFNDDESEPYKLISFQRAAKNPHAGKTILHVASYELQSDDLYDRIIEYNRKDGGKARVMMYDYADECDRDLPWNQASADIGYKLFAQMRSGTGPDIVMNFTDFGEFENEKVLVDLNTFIDGSSGIDRNLYFDNIFRAFETNGKLFQMPLSFTVWGLLGNRDCFGERSGWTYSDFESMLGSLPQGMSAFDYMEAKDMLFYMVSSDMTHFVNYEKNEVNFDSEEFINLLETAKKCEAVGSGIPDLDDNSYHSPDMNAITQNLTAMTVLRMTSLRDGYGRAYDVNHGNVTFTGLPNSDGSGMSAEARSSVGISAFSKHPDEAWDFVKYLLDEKAQQHVEGIPVLRSVSDSNNTVDIELYEEAKKNDPDPMARGSAELTEQTAAEWVSLIGKVANRKVYYPSVWMVIDEEASAFFEGQKSSKEVASTIQNRVALIVAESQ